MIRGLQTGIGFAIPSDLAKRVMAGLIKDGKSSAPGSDVSIATLRDDQDEKTLGDPVADGASSSAKSFPAARSRRKIRPQARRPRAGSGWSARAGRARQSEGGGFL